MLTRRKILTGTAAASIAAIAGAHGVAPAEAQLGCGFGDLQGGADASFHKELGGIEAFIKFDGTAADIFYKEDLFGKIQVFYKTFFKGWTPVISMPLANAVGLGTAEAYYQKVSPTGATFFLKAGNTVGVTATITVGSEGISLTVSDQTDNS
jgi:hypothetical protein